MRAQILDDDTPLPSIGSTTSRTPLGFLAAAAAMFMLMVVAASHIVLPQQASAGTGAVISISVDDETEVVTTDAATVAEVLDRAGIEVGPNDLVEPGLGAEILAGSFHINIYRARPILVVDGDWQQMVESAYRSPRLVAELSAGRTVYPEDEYQLELNRDFGTGQVAGLSVVIDRATPLKLTIDGNTLDVRTQAETVAGLLADKGIKTDDNDIINVPKSAAIKPGMKIKVVRVGEKAVAVEEPIAPPARVIYEDSQPEGYEHVRDAGVRGIKLVTYEVIYHDGEEVERKQLQSVVKKEAKTRVVVRGTRRVSNYDDPFAALRQCEAGGNYSTNTGNGYYGAYQFNLSTWQSYGGTGMPHEASPAEQDRIARRLHDARGWQPWPGCRRKLGLP